MLPLIILVIAHIFHGFTMAQGLFECFPCNQDDVLVQSCLQDPIANKFQSLDLSQSPCWVWVPLVKSSTSKGVSPSDIFSSSPNLYLSSWVTGSPSLLASTKLLLFCPCSQCLTSWHSLSDLLSRVEGPVFPGPLGLLAPGRLPVVSAMLSSPHPAELLRPSS